MEIPHEILKLIDDVATDKLSGASIIARKTAECLDEFSGWVMENDEGISTKEYIQELINIGQKLINSQPTMSPVLNAVNMVITAVKNERDETADKFKDDPNKQLRYISTFTRSAARKYIVQSKLAMEAIAKSYKDIMHDDDTIMTISASSAIELLLNEANKDSLNFTIYVPESRPMYEGRLLAQRLVQAGIKSILIADSAMFHFLHECDRVFVGSDRVTPFGLVNKIGTYGLAVTAKELKKPFYCVTEQCKFIMQKEESSLVQPEHPEIQLYSPSQDEKMPEKLVVKNIYFDFTPMEYVTNFLTEEGLISTDDAVDYIKKIKILPEFS